MSLPACPNCQSEYVYQDQNHLILPRVRLRMEPARRARKCFYGKRCQRNAIKEEGDKITLIKDLKLTGTSQVLKIGTKGVVRRIIEGKEKNHELDCKLQGIGEMLVSGKYVKKV